MSNGQKTLFGMLVSNLIGFTIIGVLSLLIMPGDHPILTFSEFIIVPMVIGIISAWFWRNLDHSSAKVALYSLYNSIIAILFAAIIFREGAICLAIVSPLIWAFIFAGTALGRAMFKKNDQRINVSVISLLVVVFIADSLATHHYENMVSDTVVIDAPVGKVWKNVVAYDRIQEPAKFWMFRIGMPSPVQSTVTAYKQGAGRKCIFSNGYVFNEKMTVFKPNQELTFDITDQPKDPEIMGHIDILGGQFILKPNADGSTTLTGNSWYRLHVFPVWYYDLWAESVTRNVHLRVMHHIKKLSEHNTGVHVSY